MLVRQGRPSQLQRHVTTICTTNEKLAIKKRLRWPSRELKIPPPEQRSKTTKLGRDRPRTKVTSITRQYTFQNTARVEYHTKQKAFGNSRGKQRTARNSDNTYWNPEVEASIFTFWRYVRRVASLGNQQNLGLNGNGRLWAQNELKHARGVSFITPRVFPAICWPKIARARKIITAF